jgi:hypothetical protein
MKMFTVILLAGLCTPLTNAADEVIPKGDKVEYHRYAKAYFEKNSSGLTGESSFLAITDQAGFEKVFGVGRVMGKAPDLLPKDAFDKKMVIAVIKRGSALFDYKDVSVTSAAGVLYVKYTAEGKGAGGTAKFASPLILTVDRSNFKSVVFVDSDKKVGNVEMKK